MIRVITIEREYGCGGGAIAKRVTDRLGWILWDGQLTSEIARLAKCERSEVEIREERVDPPYYRLLKSLLRGSFEGSIDLHRLRCLDAESLLRLTKQVTEQAASAGNCVIVGRGAQYHLRQRNDTLRIFLFAPPEERICRLKAEGISDAEAESLVDSVDRERAEFISKYFHQPWPNRHLYHAMLNTSAGEEVVTETILELKNQMESLSSELICGDAREIS